MKDYCHYHPLDPAIWQCGQCHHQYCEGCSDRPSSSGARNLCPLCNQPMVYLGSRNKVEPFWQRMPSFFKYPLKQDPVLLMLFCTVLPVFIGQNLIGLILSLALAAIQFKYMYSVVEITSTGKMDPPDLISAFTGGGFSIVFKQIGVLFLMGLMIFGASYIGNWVSILMIIFLVLALPASIIILATEQDIVQAVHPLRLTSLMLSVGWPYLVLYANLLVVGFAMSALVNLLNQQFSIEVTNALTGLASSYFLLMIFNMLGYFLYEHQGVLGFTADEDASEPSDVKGTPEMARADIYLKEGRYAEAWPLIKKQALNNPDDLVLWQRLQRILLGISNYQGLLQVSNPLLTLLFKHEQYREIISLIKSLQNHDEAFLLGDVELSLKVSELLLEESEPRMALLLIKDLPKRFPDSKLMTKVYLVLAKVMRNGFGNQKQAEMALKILRKKHMNINLEAEVIAAETALAEGHML